MRLLLDTNVLIAWITARRLSAEAREAIADPRNEAVISVIVLWEMAIKRGVRKLDLAIPTDEELEELGFGVPGVTSSDARRMAGLPVHHRDPLDRMLVAQALGESLTLVTSDRSMTTYGVDVIAA